MVLKLLALQSQKISNFETNAHTIDRIFFALYTVVKHEICKISSKQKKIEQISVELNTNDNMLPFSFTFNRFPFLFFLFTQLFLLFAIHFIFIFFGFAVDFCLFTALFSQSRYISSIGVFHQ